MSLTRSRSSSRTGTSRPGSSAGSRPSSRAGCKISCNSPPVVADLPNLLGSGKISQFCTSQEKRVAPALPSELQVSEFFHRCADEVLTPAQKLMTSKKPDPFAIHQVASLKKMAKDIRPNLETRALARYSSKLGSTDRLQEKLPPAEENDSYSGRIMIHPVTMEEMVMLSRSPSPERFSDYDTLEENIREECSPNKAYMIRHGGFPGSSHIAGENSFFLMSNIY